MPDAREEWLKTLSEDQSLQESVGVELHNAIHLPNGFALSPKSTTNLFLTLIKISDSATRTLAGQGRQKSAGPRAALVLLLAEKMCSAKWR